MQIEPTWEPLYLLPSSITGQHLLIFAAKEGATGVAAMLHFDGGCQPSFAFGEERPVMSTVPTFPLYGRVARVSRPKLRNMPGEHEGVLLPDGRVAHVTAGRFPEIVSYQQYAEGLPVRLISELEPSQTSAAIRRLNVLLRQRAPYDFLVGNCETFSRKVMGEPGVSWQVVT